MCSTTTLRPQLMCFSPHESLLPSKRNLTAWIKSFIFLVLCLGSNTRGKALIFHKKLAKTKAAAQHLDFIWLCNPHMHTDRRNVHLRSFFYLGRINARLLSLIILFSHVNPKEAESGCLSARAWVCVCARLCVCAHMHAHQPRYSTPYTNYTAQTALSEKNTARNAQVFCEMLCSSSFRSTVMPSDLEWPMGF